MHHVLVVGTHQLLALHAQILAEETAILLRFARAGQARVGRWRELLVDRVSDILVDAQAVFVRAALQFFVDALAALALFPIVHFCIFLFDAFVSKSLPPFRCVERLLAMACLVTRRILGAIKRSIASFLTHARSFTWW